MKHIYKIGLCVAFFVVATSCADNDLLEFSVEKPTTVALQEELNGYDFLKSYVNRQANTAFKLGAGVSVSEYISGDVRYRMINNNFDEVTAGYEMKHGAVVQANGSLSLSNVQNLLNMAKTAGITVYGHTLCWHANQNATYLNKTIAPEVIPSTGGPALEASVITNTDFEGGATGWAGWGNGSTRGVTAAGEGFGGTGFAYYFTNPSATNFWSAQVAYDLSPLQMGSTYVLNFRVRANTAGNIRAEIQSTSDYSSNGFGTFAMTTEWKEYTLETVASKADRNRFLFSFGDFAGTVYVDNVTLRRVNPDGGGASGKFVVADFEGDDLGITYPMTNGGSGTVVTDPQGSSKVLNIKGAQTHPQFEVTLPPGVNLGHCTTVTLDFLGTGSTGRFGAGMRMSVNGGALAAYGSPASFGAADNVWLREMIKLPVESLNLTEAQKKLNSFTLAVGSGTGTANYYIDNVTVDWKVTGDLIVEKTPEQKNEIITAELERWIAGMMEVSKEYVKAWDVVNEPMDDGSPYELKTGVGKTLSPDEFYWQDYMGKDYAVKAFELAREYGNTNDILFINDYNLEYNLDKCRGLIEYVEYIESKGVTVDGIGTQMHISTTTSKDNIVEMFELLAATGKLIKISELDIGVGVKTTAATDEHYIAQAEMYKFVVEKYLEIIPAAQRYGITIWSPRDSPENSGWRAGEPIGLWTEDGRIRKRAYAAVAEGLQ